MQSKKSKNTIFIDLDGPVLDVSERYFQVFKHIIGKLRGESVNKKAYWGLKRNKTSLEKLLGICKVSGKEKEFGRYWLNLIEKKSFLLYDKVWPFAKGILKKIRKKHKVVLVTLRRSSLNLNWQLRRLGLEKYFYMVLCQNNNNDNWSVKYDLIKNCEGLDKRSCIIGDTEIDILAGKKLGIKTIAVLSGLRGRRFLKSCKPDYIIGSLCEIMDILS